MYDFLWLRNHSTASLTIPLGDLVFFGAYFEQFSLSSPDVNKNKGVAEMAPLREVKYRKNLKKLF